MTTRPFILTLVLSLFLPLLAGAESQWDRKSKLQREDGGTYLEDFLPRGQKLVVPVKDASDIFYKGDLARYLGTLKPGQKVEVVAILGRGEAFRVRGKAQQGDVVGWIKRESLVDLPDKLVEDLIKAGERYAAVEALIEEKAVAIGMTDAEVERSLGRPERMSSRVSGTAGASAEWHYITYETVPQQVTGYDRFGRFVTTTQYVKVPSGKLKVQFKDSIVEEIERSEGIDERALGNVRIVTPPIVFRY
jgi:hypothetical protein